MLSLERCRRLLPPDSDLCDHEIEQLRNRLTAVAEVAVDQALAGSRDVKAALRIGGSAFNGALQALPSGDRESLEERAAIREFDGGEDRPSAEYHALKDFSRGRRTKP